MTNQILFNPGLKQFIVSISLFLATTFTYAQKDYWQGKLKHGYYQISKNGYYGFADSTGKVIVSPRYDEVRDFDGNLL